MHIAARFATTTAATATALLLTIASAHAACGNGTIEAGEDCDGGACCTPECSFSGSEAVCRDAVSPDCDVAEHCSGSSADCPADSLLGCSDTDGQACTTAVCTPDGCAHEESCTEICRGPGFWATHSGSEKGGENLSQAILDQTGPMMICRRAVGTTETVGTLGSILEALCVQTEDVELRELYRQLAAANLNCAISEGGTCDQITRRFVDVGFDACNTLCAGESAEGAPTVSECIRQLSCFNEGGRMIEGSCATGTCASDASTPCGAEAGDCASGDCVEFEDSCSEAVLCNADAAAPALLCPLEKRASSTSVCRAARSNACTIDQCDSAFDLLSMIANAR